MITIHFITGKIPVHSMPYWLFFRTVAFLRERRGDWGKKGRGGRKKENYLDAIMSDLAILNRHTLQNQ